MGPNCSFIVLTAFASPPLIALAGKLDANGSLIKPVTADKLRDAITKARSRYPLTDAIDILDCADAPGAAMAALRLGQRRLVLDDTCPGFGAVVAAAATKGAVVLGRRPDLSSPRQLR